MIKHATLRWSLVFALAFAGAQFACGSSDGQSSSNTAGSAGAPQMSTVAGATATNPTAGAPSSGAGGAAQPAAGSSGASVGTAGNAGSAAGAGGASPGAAGSGGAPFGVITCNPTGTGDGKHDLTTTGSPPEWTLQNGATAGTVTAKQDFVSTNYTPGHFSYWIYTSANYVKGSPAVFLLFGDGNQILNDFHTATVLDNLTAAHDLLPTVALFIDPPTDGVGGIDQSVRQQAYDPPTDKYTNFLFNEILPAVIFDKYTISRDPNAWVEVGYSASGGQGWKVLWNPPEAIRKFIGISASFGAANVAPYNVDWAQVIAAAAPHPVRASLLASTKDLQDNRGNWLTINTNVANALAAKGAQWRLEVAQASCTTDQCGHYPPVDGERDFPNALRWTFQGCKF